MGVRGEGWVGRKEYARERGYERGKDTRGTKINTVNTGSG